MAEEVEIAEGKNDYEIMPITPIRRLEKRMEQLEETTSTVSMPQVQSLVMQIIDLIRTNQKLIDEIVRADTQLRNELSRLPGKIDELVSAMKTFMDLVRAAGAEETLSPEAMKPVAEQIGKLVEQNQKLVENNQQILDSLAEISKRMRTGTPVSSLLTAYPGLKLRSEKRI